MVLISTFPVTRFCRIDRARLQSLRGRHICGIDTLTRGCLLIEKFNFDLCGVHTSALLSGTVQIQLRCALPTVARLVPE